MVTLVTRGLVFCMLPSFFVLSNDFKGSYWSKKDPLFDISVKGWWNVLSRRGAAFSYLPANLRWLFLTGHVSHPQQNITHVSSSFVFMPQQAAHSGPGVCNTLMSRQRVCVCVWLWPLKISVCCALKRCWRVCGTGCEKHYVSSLSGFLHRAHCCTFSFCFSFLLTCPWCLSHVVTTRW